jgi:sulfotransferase famil protein
MNNPETLVVESVIAFLHIPKTGGKTLEFCIYDQWSEEEYYVDKTNNLHAGIYYYPYGFYDKNFSLLEEDDRDILARNDLRAVMGHFCYGIHRHITKKTQYVTLLRNPVERAISLYHHIKPEVPLIDLLSAENSIEFRNDQTRRIAGPAQTPSNTAYKDQFTKAKTHLGEKFTVVGTTERFDEVLVLLSIVFGWNSVPNYLPHHVNISRPKSNYVNPETRKKIIEENLYDLELYNFANKILDEHISQYGDKFLERLNLFRSSQEKFLGEYPKSHWPNYID